MKKYKPAWFPSPINLPEKKVGRMAIKHRLVAAGEELNVVGQRQALLRGIRHTVVRLKKPLIIHELVETRKKAKNLWMTDLPEELNQIMEMIHTVKPEGKVLVGGLGLGILAQLVAQLDFVHDVTVVEISKDVIKLCGRPEQYKIVHSDLLTYLQTTKEKFDFYLLDTWAGTNEGTWWEDVMPLRRTIRQRWGSAPTIHCWAEDIMWGQIWRSLTFPSGKAHWYYSYLPLPMSGYGAEAFLNMVGTPWWEEEFGKKIDRYINEQLTKRNT